LGPKITNIMQKKKVKQQQHQSERFTFRLDSTILNQLHHISVNTLVRRIYWHSNAAKAVRRGFLSNLPENEISSIVEYEAKNETKDFVLLLRNEFNIESALDVIETWIKISGYPYRHEVNYARHSYVMQHDMGQNWSLYMAELYRFLFEEFGLKRVEFDIDNNTLDFVVDNEV
jgi:hypothetical protein